ncbi:MAG: transposase, partial [Verrucomicrobiales bacterium]
RLADSIPRSRIEQWKKEREAWILSHGLTQTGELQTLPPSLQWEFQRTFTKKWHDWLDAGEGGCVLRDPEIAGLVVDQLIKGHPVEYVLDAWVVMPNHLHALVTPVAGDLSRIVQRWKGASARFINQRLGRRGTLWQEEAFDHIVRSAEQLEHFRRYIAENPVKACLKPGEFELGGSSGRDFSPCSPD